MSVFTSAITSMQIPSGLFCDLVFQVSFFAQHLPQQCPALVRAPRHSRVLANKPSDRNVEYQINSYFVAHSNAFLGSSFLYLLCLGSLFYFIFIGLPKKLLLANVENVQRVAL